MSVDYGIDVLALDDLNDPEILASDALNLAYALARRLLTPAGAMAEIGDTAPYDSIDIREWLGKRISLADDSALDDLRQQCRQVLSQDPRLDSVLVDVSFGGGLLSVSVDGTGAAGPFNFVLQTAGVTAAFLRSA